MKTRGLEGGSLFKYLFIGHLVMMVVLPLAGLVIEVLWPDSANVFKGTAEVEVGVNDNKIVDKQADSSESVGDYVNYLIGVPFLTAMWAGCVWLFLFFGQYLYSYFHPIQLNLTRSGLDLISTFRLFMIGFLCTVAPIGVLTSLIGIIENGYIDWLTINGEAGGIGVGIILIFVVIPVFSVVAAALGAVTVFLGARIFSVFKPVSLRVIPFSKGG